MIIDYRALLAATPSPYLMLELVRHQPLDNPHHSPQPTELAK
ncbi:hypothetical protein ACF09C_27055 [Streptomyces sp. NPDC014870]